MKKSFATLVLLFSLGLTSFGQAPPVSTFQLTQVAVEQRHDQIDLQFNNPTQSKLTLVLRESMDTSSSRKSEKTLKTTMVNLI